MTPQVAVAVVSWNTRDLLRACLRSLGPEVDAGRAEVWVVDNASSDGSPETVREEFPWARLIASRQNLGFGPAVNLVAARSSAPWLAPANADVELRPGALETLLSAGSMDPGAGVVAPRLVRPNGSTQHSVHPFPTVTLSVLVALRAHRLSPRLGDRLCIEGSWDPDRSRRVDWAHAAFLLVRRAAFDAVGGFAQEQWLYAEDLDLAWRLRAAGWATRYEAPAAVRHEVSAATRQAFDDRVGRYMAATYSWMLRRRGLAVTRAFAGVNVAGAAARAAALTPLAVVWPSRWAAARNHARAYARHHRLGLRAREAILESR